VQLRVVGAVLGALPRTPLILVCSTLRRRSCSCGCCISFRLLQSRSRTVEYRTKCAADYVARPLAHLWSLMWESS